MYYYMIRKIGTDTYFNRYGWSNREGQIWFDYSGFKAVVQVAQSLLHAGVEIVEFEFKETRCIST